MERQKRSSQLARVATAAAALALSAVLAEVALRLLPAGVVVEPNLYRMADGLLLLRRDWSGRHVTPLWDVALSTNSRGFRDFEREPREDEAVVLGLGDSQAFGWGVELEETFFSRIEADLPPVRLLKAAVPGTGTSDQVEMLARFGPAERPRVVLIALFVGNDFVDVERGGSAQYEVVDGFLAHRGEGGGQLRRLAIESRLLQALRAAQFRLGLAPQRKRMWDSWMREYAQVHLLHPPERTRLAIAETIEALDQIVELSRGMGATPLLVAIPRSFQIDPAEAAEMARGLGWAPEELDLEQPQSRLAAWADEQDVAFVDLLEPFRAASRAGGQPLFYTPDAHLTAAGHAVAAQAVRPALAQALASVDAGPQAR
ncbi:MAG: GDSL-type esterase/lipase family protein [Bryobacterales bacterium]